MSSFCPSDIVKYHSLLSMRPYCGFEALECSRMVTLLLTVQISTFILRTQTCWSFIVQNFHLVCTTWFFDEDIFLDIVESVPLHIYLSLPTSTQQSSGLPLTLDNTHLVQYLDDFLAQEQHSQNSSGLKSFTLWVSWKDISGLVSWIHGLLEVGHLMAQMAYVH